jgi:predicted ATPase/class 3 adenylate cyclase/DNA-binding CsgD family transcriptional regulator
MTGDMGDLPTGTLTFVLGDIASSTSWWEQDPAAMGPAVTSWYALISLLSSEHDGYAPLEQGEGDSFVRAFVHARDAARFALALTDGLHQGGVGLPLTTRLGIHTGEAVARDDSNYMGETLNRCARLRNLGTGGQILVSGTAAALLVDDLSDGAFLKDLGVHRLRDLGRPEHIRQLCHPSLPIEFPPLRSLDRLPNNLPVQLTSFIGRANELEQAPVLLADSRVVTLVGPGGSGKTRLALQVGAEMLEEFPGGVWLADLAAIDDGALVGEAVMAAMGASEGTRRSPVEYLAETIGTQATLVLLDNCEHVIQHAADFVEQLTARCAGVTVLTTSREPLAVDGEQCMRVPTMSLPEDSSDATCESVALFADRARLARPTFRLTTDNLRAVVEICRRLDGIPLAIELAAARCRAIAPGEIAELLGDHFRLLTGGRRNALARQRTLEASVEWSHDLLDEQSRALFRRLSVFVGGWTLHGAEAVCATDDLRAWEVVELLTGLVDKSLVQGDVGGAVTRYRMLETIRHYARERLLDVGEATAIREAHTRYYTELMQEAEVGLDGPGVRAWIARLDAEIDNLRATYDWCVEGGRDQESLRQMLSVWMFWHLRHAPEALERIERVLPAAGEERPRALYAASWMAWGVDDFANSLAWSREALELARASGDDRLLGCALEVAGWNLMWTGIDDGKALVEEGLALLRHTPDVWFYVDGLWGLATLATATGDYESAEAANAEALVASRTADNPLLIGRSLILSAIVLINRGRFREAADVIRDGRALLDPLKDVWLLWADAYEALLLALCGDTTAAIAIAQRARGERRGHLTVASSFATYSEAVAQHYGLDLGTAVPLLEEAEQLCETSMLLAVVGVCRSARGWRAAAQGDVAAGRRLVDDAHALCRGTILGGAAVHIVGLCSALVARIEGDMARAESDALDALVGNASCQRPWAMDTMELVAGLITERRPQDAARLLGAAEAERERTGCARAVAYRAHFDRDLADLQRRLDRDDFAVAFSEGSAMTFDQAVAYATRGRGARDRPASGWASLTPTERDVAALVAEGLRNADVATKLFVSTSTVKTHLSHVFAKLDISSRSELVAITLQNS